MRTDEIVIQRVLAGDVEAFGELVRRYQAEVIAWARGILGHEHDAEDAAQEVFVRAYQSLAQLRDPKRLPGWLRQVCHSVCVDRLRKPRVFRAKEAEIADGAPSPDQQVEGLELAAAVVKALTQLPVKYQAPVRLFHLEGFSQEEIAHRLGIKPGGVRVRLHRGRKLLGAMLQAYAPERTFSRDKQSRAWLPSNLRAQEVRTMALQYDTTRRKMLKGDAEVTIRSMAEEDIPLVRAFDRELTASLDEVNVAIPPGGNTSDGGGPWSDDEWLQIHFRKYSERGNLTLLAMDSHGRVVGFADLWQASEPEPFGRSLDVECIDYLREYYLAGLETVLLQEARKVAGASGLTALDVGTNTCSGDYQSLRHLGFRVFYEYDEVLCRCGKRRAAKGVRRKTLKATAMVNVDARGLLRVNHWCPTDFWHHCPEEIHHFTEFASPYGRAVLELWRHESGAEYDPAVPPNVPNQTALSVEPNIARSSEAMALVLGECAAVAGDLGAELIPLPCPSALPLDEARLGVQERTFRYSWWRWALRGS